MRLIKFLILFVLFLTACGKDDNPSTIENDSNNGNENEVVDNEDDQDGDGQNEETPPPNSPPGNFNLLTFENQMENVELTNPEFSWEEAIDPDGNAVTYSLFLNEGLDSPSTLIAENLTETSFVLETVLPRNTQYSWQVVASDSEGASTNSEVQSFVTRPIIVSELVSNAEFDGRTEHASLVYNDKIWIIGGVDQFEVADDIWSSTDGATWIKETNNADFSSRGEHGAVVFNDKMWVVAGVDNEGNLLNDVWSSENGVDWVLETDNASFPPRYEHALTVFQNKLWLIGGNDSRYEFDDIWMSEDGINWELITDDAEFPARYEHCSIVFNDRIYVIGGINSNQGSGFGALNDVWSSPDGINWEIETVDAEFSPRWGHSTTVLNGEIWIIGGLGGGRKNDVWSSKNGIDWIEESVITPEYPLTSRFNHSTVTYMNQLVLIGGNDGSRRNDVFTIMP